MIVTVGNNKGGVGKTGIIVQLAAALSRAGYKVLVIDMDPQGNAGRQLGWTNDPDAPAPTVSDALRDGRDGVAEDALVTAAELQSGIEVDLLPSSIDLENRISEAATVGAVRRLRKVLAGWAEDYDVALIDTPPSLGHLTQMALAASQTAVCVTQPEYDSVEGVTRFRSFVHEHAEDLSNPGLRFAGVVVNLHKRLNEHAYQLEGLTELLGAEQILSPVIPERAVMKEAAAAGVSVAAYGAGPGKEMAQVFDDLATDFLSKIGAAK